MRKIPLLLPVYKLHLHLIKCKKLKNIFCLIIKEFCEGSGDKSSIPPTLLLILSRLCLDFEGSTISYLVKKKLFYFFMNLFISYKYNIYTDKT